MGSLRKINPHRANAFTKEIALAAGIVYDLDLGALEATGYNRIDLTCSTPSLPARIAVGFIGGGEPADPLDALNGGGEAEGEVENEFIIGAGEILILEVAPDQAKIGWLKFIASGAGVNIALQAWQ